MVEWHLFALLTAAGLFFGASFLLAAGLALEQVANALANLHWPEWLFPVRGRWLKLALAGLIYGLGVLGLLALLTRVI